MKWEDIHELSERMAIEVIVDNLVEIMVPADMARKRANAHQAAETQDYLRVRFDMYQAIVVLETLGYEVQKSNNSLAFPPGHDRVEGGGS